MHPDLARLIANDRSRELRANNRPRIVRKPKRG
jgi:hypothetical protein